MPGGENFNIQKERILSLIKMKGPSLPVQIARGIGVSPLFAGAFLSELYNDKKIKISDMRVGSSPLYYISGQEAMLENFVEHLNAREKEAFYILKRDGILDDDTLSPIIRVALRAIKDFAIPIKVKFNDNTKIFWRHFLLSEEDAKTKIHSTLSSKIRIEAKEVVEVKKEEAKPIKISVAPINMQASEPKIESKEISGKSIIIAEREEKKSYIEDKSIEDLKEKPKKKVVRREQKKKSKIQENIFPKKIKEYLSTKDIEILGTVLEKKREYIGKVRIDMLFGKQEFYLVAKDKKSISDNDLAIALHNAQSFKMPVLVVSSGELSKKAEEYLKEWRNLIRFERVKV